MPTCVISINEPGALYIAMSQNEALPEYDWMTTVGNAVGFHGEDDIEVIFIYRLRSLITITPDNRRASPGGVINYTVVITNEAAGIIEDSYTVRIHFDLRFSPVFRLEFTLDYLEMGDTVIHFSMPIHQSSLVGNKNVKAILIHPTAMIDIYDTEVLTQIEIIHQEAEPPALQPPTLQPQAPQLPAPQLPAPPTNVPPVHPNEPEDVADNEDIYGDYEEDAEVDNAEREEELYNNQEEDDLTDTDDDFNVEEEEDLVEDVDSEDIDSEDIDPKDEEQVEATLSMIGTLTYDVSILGAIIVVNFKNWRKMTAIRF